jgi:MHS family metabolite:H+ symporter-like MFS transporter
MAREISAVLAGGLAGVLGAYLIAVTGGNWVLLAIYMAVLALITTASTFLAPETLRRDLTRVDDAIKVSRGEGGDDVFATTVSITAVGR